VLLYRQVDGNISEQFGRCSCTDPREAPSQYMLKKITHHLRLHQTRYSFGMTSAIVTNLALVVGLDWTSNPKISIVAAILVIAVADNIADSLGIHIFQESEQVEKKEVWISTITNFLARFFVSLTFILLVLFLPIKMAVFIALVWGLSLLTLLSYIIAKDEGESPFMEILKHLGIAVLVIAASEVISRLIMSNLH